MDTHTILWLTAYLLGIVLSGVLSVRAGLGRLNPVTAYGAIWGGVVLVMSLGLVDVRPLEERTWWIIAGSTAAFMLGCFTALGLPIGKGTRPRSAAPARYDDDRIVALYRIGLVVLVVYVATQVIAALPMMAQAGGIEGILTGQGEAFRRAQTDAAAADAGTGGSIAAGLFGYALFCGLLTLIWGGYLARRGRWFLALAPLVVMAGYSVLALQRSAFIYCLLLFAFSYVYHRDFVPPAQRRRPPTALAVTAVLVVAVIFVPLALRQPADPSAPRIPGPLTYFVDGAAGLNELVRTDAPPVSPYPGQGRWTLYGPASLLDRFAVPLEMPPHYFEYVDVGVTRELNNNVYSYLVLPLYDFGPAGLAIFPFLLGFAATALHQLVRRTLRPSLVLPAAMLMGSIVMSFFALSFFHDARWTVLVIGGFAVERLVLRRRPAPALHRNLLATMDHERVG